jgi:predicted dehydrogenase
MPRGRLYSSQMAEFIDAVEEERDPSPTGKDGRVVMDVVERAYRAAADPR